MPGAIAHLVLDDLPAISGALKGRLERARVREIPALHALAPAHARLIWRSVEGERFVGMLQGMDIPLQATERGGFGNSKVLSPEYRTARQAYLVGRWLVEKATARLRREGQVAARFSLALTLERGRGRGGWHGSLRCFASQDSGHFLRLHRALWRRLWQQRADPGPVLVLGVHLGEVGFLRDRQGDLFAPLAAGAIHYGVNQPHPGFFEKG